MLWIYSALILITANLSFAAQLADFAGTYRRVKNDRESEVRSLSVLDAKTVRYYLVQENLDHELEKEVEHRFEFGLEKFEESYVVMSRGLSGESGGFCRARYIEAAMAEDRFVITRKLYEIPLPQGNARGLISAIACNMFGIIPDREGHKPFYVEYEIHSLDQARDLQVKFVKENVSSGVRSEKELTYKRSQH